MATFEILKSVLNLEEVKSKKASMTVKWKQGDPLTGPNGTPSKEESQYMTSRRAGGATWVPGKGWEWLY